VIDYLDDEYSCRQIISGYDRNAMTLEITICVLMTRSSR